MQATQLWSHWQDLLRPCADAFTSDGFRRFTEWITGLALNVEEHTITQSLVGLNRVASTECWRDWQSESLQEFPLRDRRKRRAAHAHGRLNGILDGRTGLSEAFRAESTLRGTGSQAGAVDCLPTPGPFPVRNMPSSL
jgi:hypothetical protein